MVNIGVQPKFTHLYPIDSLEVLNLRASMKRLGCPSCHCEGSMNSHGYTRGYLGFSHEREVRRLRFFALIEGLTQAAEGLSRFSGRIFLPVFEAQLANS